MHSADPNRKLRVLSWSLHGLGALIACAIGLAAEMVGYRPLDAEVAGCARQTAELQGAIRDGERLRAEHARLRRDLASAREQSADLIERIPDQPQEADFLAQLSQLADDSGLKIQDYRPGVITPRSSYATMKVDVICAGDYESICTFLDGLAELPRHCTVVRFEIDSASQGELYSVELSQELYIATVDQPDVARR